MTNSRRPEPGEAKSSINFLHTVEEGVPVCKLRGHFKRYFDSEVGNSVDGLFELRKDVGTDHVKFLKCDENLYTFDSDGTLSSALLSSLTVGSKFWFTSGFTRAYMANTDDGNYVSDGTTAWALVRAAPSGNLGSLTEAGTATGFGTGVFEYAYSDYDPTNGWESVPVDGFTKTKASANLGVTITDPGTYTAQYTKKRIYRRLRGTNQWYLVAEKATGDFPFNDVLLESDFTDSMLSEVHDNETGLIDMEVPADSPVVIFHKGRLFLTEDSQLRWSKAGLPFIFRSSGVATHDFGDDEDVIVACVSFRNKLIVLKKRSIWLLYGDENEDTFYFEPVTKALGCLGRFTWVLTPTGIVFVGSDYQFWRFDLSTLTRLGGTKGFDLRSYIDITYIGYSHAGWEPVNNIAYFSLASGTGVLGTTHNLFAVSVESGAISTCDVLQALITGCFYFAEMSQGDQEGVDEGERKLFFGDGEGVIFEMERSDGRLADGPTTVGPTNTSGTVTSATSTTLVDSGANFLAEVIGFRVTVIKPDGTVRTSAIVTARSSTQLTVASWPTAEPQVGDTYHIGAMHALLWLGGIDGGTQVQKRVGLVEFHVQPDSTGDWFIGVTDDESSDRTVTNALVDVATEPGLASLFANSFVRRTSPFLEAYGTGLAMEVDSIDMEVTPMRQLL